MNRTAFAKYISENLSISPKKADKLIDDFTTNLSQAIFEGHVVSLDELGHFIPRISVLTPKDSVIKSSHNPVFIPDEKLKGANVNAV